MKTKYKYRGFTIIDYHDDNGIDNLRDFIAPSHLHTCAANEHIGDIDRSIRKIKERVRCGCYSIPYKKFTKLMTISLVQDIITCLNMFPSKNGVSSNLSPAEFILGYPNLDYNKLKVTFGAYAQVYKDTTNSTKQIMVGYISLRPTNERGEYYFMSLAIGKQLHAFIWTELPIDNQVISRVNNFATK